MKRAILLGPALRDTAELKKLMRRLKSSSRDLKVGVDGGVDRWLTLGMTPDFAVGDWDSVSLAGRRRVLKGISHLTLEKRKERSDLHYALLVAHSWRADEIVALGFTGGRADHHLAAIFELTEAAGKGSRISAMGPEAEYHWITPAVPWTGKVSRGKGISVFALTSEARGVSLGGVEYALRNSVLLPSSRGLSNVAKGGEVSLRLKRGVLLLLIPSDEESRSSVRAR